MTSRQRFDHTMKGKQVDRFAIDYCASREADVRIRRYFGVASEKDLLDLLGCDFYYLSARDISQNEAILRIYRGPPLTMSDRERICPLGIRFQRGAYGWKFGADEALAGPLEKATSPRDVLSHSWPSPSWFDPEPMLAECEANSSRVIVGGVWSAIFGDAYRMHGFANFLTNMALKPDLIHALVDRLTDLYLELNERMFTSLKGKMDIFYFGNDFGSQDNLLFSREMWDEFYRESYGRLISLAHSHGLKVMAHSCGAIAPLVQGFIETGVDILDPVQTTARGMDPAELLPRVGSRMVLHGAIDTQGVLPLKQPEEVVKHATDIMAALGGKGRYILAPCNSIQADTPCENVDAMYRAARGYRLSGGE